MDSVQAFYDDLAESYHLIFEDWDRSIDRQGDALAAVLAERLGRRGGHVLDVAAGIGTQALGLAARGYEVLAADLSSSAIARARREGVLRGILLPVVVADFRELPFAANAADAVIACDNALPHLLSEAEIRTALSEMMRCARPGGAVVVSMRDYKDAPPPGTVEHRPYGERLWNGRRYVAEQEWHWQGETYRVVLRIRPVEGDAGSAVEVQTTYLSVPVNAILELMQEVGLTGIQRLDSVYYQPLLLGTAPDAA